MFSLLLETRIVPKNSVTTSGNSVGGGWWGRVGGRGGVAERGAGMRTIPRPRQCATRVRHEFLEITRESEACTIATGGHMAWTSAVNQVALKRAPFRQVRGDASCFPHQGHACSLSSSCCAFLPCGHALSLRFRWPSCRAPFCKHCVFFLRGELRSCGHHDDDDVNDSDADGNDDDNNNENDDSNDWASATELELLPAHCMCVVIAWRSLQHEPHFHDSRDIFCVLPVVCALLCSGRWQGDGLNRRNFIFTI